LSQARDIAASIAQEESGSGQHQELVGLHRSVVMAAGNIASKFRLTVRSSVDRYVRKVAPSGPKPWDDDVA
jgi:hypothetical protein